MSKNSRIIDMFCCCETRDFLVYFRCWPAIMLSKRVNSMNNIQNYNPNVSPAPQYIPYPPPVDLRFMTEQIEAWAYEAGKTQATLKFRENQLEAVSGLVKQYGASYIISSRGTPIQVFADQLSTAEYLCFHALFERENMICLTFRSGRTFTVSESVFASDISDPIAYVNGTTVSLNQAAYKLIADRLPQSSPLVLKALSEIGALAGARTNQSTFRTKIQVIDPSGCRQRISVVRLNRELLEEPGVPLPF